MDIERYHVESISLKICFWECLIGSEIEGKCIYFYLHPVIPLLIRKAVDGSWS